MTTKAGPVSWNTFHFKRSMQFCPNPTEAGAMKKKPNRPRTSWLFFRSFCTLAPSRTAHLQVSGCDNFSNNTATLLTCTPFLRLIWLLLVENVSALTTALLWSNNWGYLHLCYTPKQLHLAKLAWHNNKLLFRDFGGAIILSLFFFTMLYSKLLGTSAVSESNKIYQLHLQWTKTQLL